MAEIEDYIREHFVYDNGKIIRDDKPNANGSLDKDGYLIIKIKGKQFKAHRLVWFLCNGSFPKTELDHINRIRTDNRIENLRESNRKQQIQNREQKPNKDTGYIGVHLYHKERYLSKPFATRYKGKRYAFSTVEEAVNFRKEKGLIV